jgi:hypothetical protein
VCLMFSVAGICTQNTLRSDNSNYLPSHNIQGVSKNAA